MKGSDIIRAEIMRILNENGRTRGTELAKRAIKKVGDEKTVYDKSHIEYEIINYDKLASEQLEEIYYNIDTVFVTTQEFSLDERIPFYDRLRHVVDLIYAIEDINGMMRMLSFYPTFKRDKMFGQIIRRVDDCWHEIMKVISSQKERDFIDSVFDCLRARPDCNTHVN